MAFSQGSLRGPKTLRISNKGCGRLRALAGESGFMRFLTIDHGALLRLFGAPVKARFYSVGNPLLAMTMLKHDPGVALNVPVRLLIYAAPDGTTRIGYDLPSSLMSQLGNTAVAAAAEKLDAKLAAFVERIAKENA